MTKVSDDLQQKISSLSDEELVKMVTLDVADFRQEAIDLALKEIAARGLTVSETEETEEVEDGNEGENKEEDLSENKTESGDVELKPFRTLVVLSQVCTLGFYIIQFVTEDRISADLKSYYGVGEGTLSYLIGGGRSVIDSFMEIFTFNQWKFLSIIVLDIMTFIAAVGLFLLRKWASALFLSCLLLRLILIAKTPFHIETGLTVLITYVGTIIEGMILAIIYFTNFKERFETQTRKYE